MPPTKALRLALSRAAEEMWALAVRVQGIRQEELDPEGLLANLDDSMLLFLLDGPDGVVGAAAVDQPALAALIEIQTLGRVLPDSGKTRQPTRTDAAMIAPLLDRSLAGLAANLQENGDGWWAEGFAYGDMLEDRRTLGLAMRAGAFRSFRMTVDFDHDVKQGTILFALPIVDRPEVTKKAAPEHPVVTYEAQMVHVPTELDVALDRVRMPLDKASSLKPGDLLPLSLNALQQVVVRGADGKRLAIGTLGQVNGQVAVRLAPQPGLPAKQTEAAQQDARKGNENKPAKAVKPVKLPDLPAVAAPPAPVADDGLPDLPPMDFDAEDNFLGDFALPAEG